MTHYSEFGLPEQPDWRNPDHLVALYKFKLQLLLDLAVQSHKQNEIIPITALHDEIDRQLGLDQDNLFLLSFAGEMIDYDRTLRSETPEEKAEREAKMNDIISVIDDMAKEEFGGIDGLLQSILEKIEDGADEVKSLEQMFNEND